jgi:hypothetical protein
MMLMLRNSFIRNAQCIVGLVLLIALVLFIRAHTFCTMSLRHSITVHKYCFEVSPLTARVMLDAV